MERGFQVRAAVIVVQEVVATEQVVVKHLVPHGALFTACIDGRRKAVLTFGGMKASAPWAEIVRTLPSER